MAVKKELFINSVRMVEVNDRENVPSVVYFGSGGARIGYEAWEAAPDHTELNENFKIALGESARERLDPPRFETADGRDRSAHEITKVFIESLLKKVGPFVEQQGLKQARRVLVAEPLALDRGVEKSEEWLTNYRTKLKAILAPHFEEVDFLPEPFAVFQYYRYGIRHSLLAASKRHAAMVIDFGGGTFDVSVVETTAAGDVSRSGRNSRPLAAASIPVGGSTINLAIAKQLVARHLEKGVDKAKVAKGWEAFRHGSYQELRPDLRQFVRNARRVFNEVEQAKLHICDTLLDWGLDTEYKTAPAMQIEVPTNPFADKPTWVEVRFDAIQFRDVFIKQIWNDPLRHVVENAVSRAQDDLEGRPIELVLLSGGSANIRWLTKLIEQIRPKSFPDAEVLELQGNFQEVVAKGLAVECARRTFNEGTSDFQAVTYNRLCLVLGADDAVPTARRYKSLREGQTKSQVEGTLLESAFVVKGAEEVPLRWKFRLPSPPKHHLDYYFLKSSLDYTDVQGLFNIDHRVSTPKTKAFDSNLILELLVSADGTARPKFIYHQAGGGTTEVSVEGTPFYLDMTYAEKTTLGGAYVGIDFGTSNSSVSYVEQNAVRQYTERASEKGWRELNDLVEVLPYPAASPLVRFLASSSEAEIQARFPAAFEFLLFTALSLLFADYRVTPEARKTSIFRQFTKGSAGPMWAVLRAILEKGARDSLFTPKLGVLLQLRNKDAINSAIEAINDIKHQRSSSFSSHRDVLAVLGNAVHSALDGWRFGRFEGVVKKGFSSAYTGLFRAAHGAHAPFLELYEYRGPEPFSELEAVVANPERRVVLRLAPLMFWTPFDTSGEQTIAALDGVTEKSAEFKTIIAGKALVVTELADEKELLDMARACSANDSDGALSIGLGTELRPRGT